MKWVTAIAIITTLIFAGMWFRVKNNPAIDNSVYEKEIADQIKKIYDAQIIIDSLKEQYSVIQRHDEALENQISQTRIVYVTQTKPAFTRLSTDSAISLLSKSLTEYAAQKDSV